MGQEKESFFVGALIFWKHAEIIDVFFLLSFLGFQVFGGEESEWVSAVFASSEYRHEIDAFYCCCGFYLIEFGEWLIHDCGAEGVEEVKVVELRLIVPQVFHFEAIHFDDYRKGSYFDWLDESFFSIFKKDL